MTKRYGILVVDDEELVRKTLGLDLEDEGYNVTLAQNGEEAIKKIGEDDFDMIISDLMMEGIGGLQVLKEAKKKSPHILTLVLTGYGSLTSAIDALRLNASDYMLKPYDKTELYMRVSGCFEKSELQKKLTFYENILPMCSICKKVRDDSGRIEDKGSWVNVDTYLVKESKLNISHVYCGECQKKMKKDVYLGKQKKMQDMRRLAK